MTFRPLLFSLLLTAGLAQAQTPSFNPTSKDLILPVLALSDGTIAQDVHLSLYDGATWQVQSIGSSGRTVPISSNTYPLKTSLVGFPGSTVTLPTDYRLTLANGQIWRFTGSTAAQVNVATASDPKKPTVTIYTNTAVPGFLMQFADDAALLPVLPTSDVDPQVVAALGNAGVPVTASTIGNIYPLKTTLYRFAGSIPPGFRLTLANGQIWKSTSSATVTPTVSSTSPAVVLYRDSKGYTLQFVDSATSLGVEPTNDVDNTIGSGGGSSSGGGSTALTLTPATLSLYPMQSGTLTIAGGTPPYQAASSNTSLVRVDGVDSNSGKLQISSRAATGSATVVVADRSGLTASMSITVALPASTSTTTTQ